MQLSSQKRICFTRWRWILQGAADFKWQIVLKFALLLDRFALACLEFSLVWILTEWTILSGDVLYFTNQDSWLYQVSSTGSPSTACGMAVSPKQFSQRVSSTQCFALNAQAGWAKGSFSAASVLCWCLLSLLSNCMFRQWSEGDYIFFFHFSWLKNLTDDNLWWGKSFCRAFQVGKTSK